MEPFMKCRLSVSKTAKAYTSCQKLKSQIQTVRKIEIFRNLTILLPFRHPPHFFSEKLMYSYPFFILCLQLVSSISQFFHFTIHALRYGHKDTFSDRVRRKCCNIGKIYKQFRNISLNIKNNLGTTTVRNTKNQVKYREMLMWWGIKNIGYRILHFKTFFLHSYFISSSSEKKRGGWNLLDKKSKILITISDLRWWRVDI